MDTSTLLPRTEAARRIAIDHGILLRRLEGRTPDELAAAYQVESGPLGDFCASLHDLLAHVLMWDEISLAVLTEARAGREHWSLEARWETPEVGRMLNRAGVLAGREIPADLLLHRLRTTHDALLTEIRGYTEAEWLAAGEGRSFGALTQHTMTVPSQPPYVHAAIHLGELDWLRS